jgi:tetratricopeptide (TPR) repeat protein
MRWSICLPLLGLLLAAPVCAEDWQGEKNLYKRAEKGLEVAEAQLDAARETYRNGDPYKAQAELEDSLETIMEAYQVIVDSGEDMRKRASRFKKFEIRLRGIYRKMEDHETQAEVLDRGPIERARQTVSKMQDKLLEGMFQGGPLASVEKVT